MTSSFGKRGMSRHAENVSCSKLFGAAPIDRNARKVALAVLVGLPLMAAIIYGVAQVQNKRDEQSRILGAEQELAARVADIQRGMTLQMESIKTQVAAMLKNPDSAKFRNVTINPKTMAVCGFVNGTNGYGGYAGESKFVSADGMIYLLKQPYDGSNEAGRAAYYNHCD